MLAELLAGETIAAERELLALPALHRTLGITRRLRSALRESSDHAYGTSTFRMMRFDFHWTENGWRISEVNSDVPGGFTEASSFPQMMARLSPGLESSGDPAGVWAREMQRISGGEGHVALIAAPGFMEDQQVVAYLASRLRAAGITAHLAEPSQLIWNQNDVAFLRSGDGCAPLAAILRFYQAEWLERIRPMRTWRKLIAGCVTPVVNTGSEILTESKRFPLVWDALRGPLSTWRCLLPETRDPRAVPWRTDEAWLLKTAFCNTGDTVTARDLVSAKRWRSACLDIRLRPRQWIAQRRFQTVPIDSPAGRLCACLGVFTINGKAAGAYGRLSHGQVVDYRAIDAAVLVEPDDPRDNVHTDGR
jgi:glutathionylspermidine synthase